jgi:hypothetical protein
MFSRSSAGIRATISAARCSPYLLGIQIHLVCARRAGQLLWGETVGATGEKIIQWFNEIVTVSTREARSRVYFGVGYLLVKG